MRDFLDDEAQGDVIARNSAVFLGKTHESQARFQIRLQHVVGGAAGRVHLRDPVLGVIAIRELAHAFQDELLFVSETEIHCNS